MNRNRSGWTRVTMGFGVILAMAAEGCHTEETGSTLHLLAYHHASPDLGGSIPDHSEPDGRTFTTDNGWRIALRHGYVVISAVELLRPAALSVRSPASSDLLAWLEPFRPATWIPTAQAHTKGSPTRLGAPSVIDLLDPDGAGLELGILEPPPGTYDRLRVTIAPADDDAAHRPSDIDMVDRTVALSGTAVRGVDSLEFSITMAATDSVEIPFAAPNGTTGATLQPLGVIGSRLHLAGGEQFSAGIGMTYDRWFEGVDFAHDAPAARDARVLSNIMGSFDYRPATAMVAPGPIQPTRP